MRDRQIASGFLTVQRCRRPRMSSLGKWLVALLLPLMLPAFDVSAQSIERVTWKKSADIVGSAVARNTGGRPWRVTFKVVVSGVLGKRYVGCTYMDADGNEIDVHAKSVGTFSRTAEFTVPSADAERIIFALWKDKGTRLRIPRGPWDTTCGDDWTTPGGYVCSRCGILHFQTAISTSATELLYGVPAGMSTVLRSAVPLPNEHLSAGSDGVRACAMCSSYLMLAASVPPKDRRVLVLRT